jgi:hypothetical protein
LHADGPAHLSPAALISSTRFQHSHTQCRETRGSVNGGPAKVAKARRLLIPSRNNTWGVKFQRQVHASNSRVTLPVRVEAGQVCYHGCDRCHGTGNILHRIAVTVTSTGPHLSRLRPAVTLEPDAFSDLLLLITPLAFVSNGGPTSPRITR